jgi:serine/threonine protein kinase
VVTEPPRVKPSPLPASIAGYRIDRVLGGGAMSTVYLARSPHVPQWAALKVLPAQKARNPALRARFVQEGETTARLGHPNVVAIYGRGETSDGQLRIAMQYITGTDAEAALQDGVMTPVRALRIVAEVAKVLDYVHRCGVVHQDVKPSNILLAERTPDQERVILSDFGAALTAASSDPADSAMMASVAYAAPEVLVGHPVDGRADVYSLGCTLFRLLTNRYPYPGDGGIAATITAHLQQPPPTLSEVLPWAGPALDGVIATALAKDPAGRYRSASELAAAAATASGHTHGVPRPPGRARAPHAAPVSAPIRPPYGPSPRLSPRAPGAHRRGRGNRDRTASQRPPGGSRYR